MDLIRAAVKALKELSLLLSPSYRLWVRGLEPAYRLSKVAHRWGNGEALEWRLDRSYVIFCGLLACSGYQSNVT